MARHLGDDQSLDHVERMAARLLEIMRQHLEAVVPAYTSATLEQVLNDMEDRRQRLLETAKTAIEREMIEIELNRQRQSIIQRKIREGKI